MTNLFLAHFSNIEVHFKGLQLFHILEISFKLWKTERQNSLLINRNQLINNEITNQHRNGTALTYRIINRESLTFMKTSSIYYSDIIQLIKLYSVKPNNPFIFDPYGRLEIDHEEELAEEGCKILVNLAGRLTEYKGMSLDSFDLILDFGKVQAPSNFDSQTLKYINQPEGNMRWLYQGKHLKNVLSFYNASGKRGKFISTAIKVISKLGLDRLASNGQIKIYAKEVLKLNQVTKEYWDQYSIFMGTPGLQRSVLVALLENKKVVKFLKVPTSEASSKLIENEKNALLSQHLQTSAYLKLPKVTCSENSKGIIVENVKEANSERIESFTTIHAAFITENLINHSAQTTLKQTSFWKETQAAFHQDRFSKNAQLLELRMLGERIIYGMNEDAPVLTHWAHGDFTPWNMYLNEDKIALYDWEMYREEAPALFDLFHFHYQKGILMDHFNLQQIELQIEETLRMKTIRKAIKNKSIDVQLYQRLYLLTTVGYFMQVYGKQRLTIQNQWQIETWKKALIKELQLMESNENCRTYFIEELNRELQSTPHAFLKFDYKSLTEVPESSDLDLAITKQGIKKIIQCCEQSPLIKRWIHRQKSFMSTIEIHFIDDRFLSLDLIHQFKRKHLTMLSAKDLLRDSFTSEKGIMLPSLKHDLAYAFSFYTLNHSAIPLRYHQFFSNHSSNSITEAINYINHLYGTDFKNLAQLFTQGRTAESQVAEALYDTSLFTLMSGKWNYYIDTIKELIYHRGFMVTFSGVDGAGKSTVIEIVKNNIERKYRKEVVLLRHRPGILPILSAIKHGKQKAEKIAGDTLPRKGKNNNKISSAARFLYYYLDYMIGQVYVYFRYILRGKIVLYDRYYFDFINDAKRSNIQINRNITKALYRFVMKPKLNIFLYAEAETILARKQELNAEDITEMSSNYRSLFDELKLKFKKSYYTSIENNILDDTIAAVLREFAKVA